MKQIDLTIIRKRRKELNLSLREVSKRLGYKGHSSYQKYETGVYILRADMIPKLAEVLDIPIEKFFIDDSSKTEQ